MKSEEFCKECKHHYSFHLEGDGQCEFTGYLRTKGGVAMTDVRTACSCRKFIGEITTRK